MKEKYGWPIEKTVFFKNKIQNKKDNESDSSFLTLSIKGNLKIRLKHKKACSPFT